MRTKFKAWAEPYLLEHPEASYKEEEISSLDNFILEIGSGKGEFLIKMANKFPNETFLGIEKNVTCAGITCKKLVENEISNAKIIFNDVEKLFPLFKDKSVKNIYLNFSDPWPKKKHHKRRLTNKRFLDSYRRILKDDGLIIFKTDNDELFEDSLLEFEENNFHIIEVDRNYDGLDDIDTCTEYEEFFRNENIAIKRVKVGL